MTAEMSPGSSSTTKIMVCFEGWEGGERPDRTPLGSDLRGWGWAVQAGLHPEDPGSHVRIGEGVREEVTAL